MSKPTDGIPDQDRLWKRMSFKGNKVWTACDADGAPLIRNNKVRIKYNLDQTHEYWIKRENLKPEDQAVPAGARQKKTGGKSARAKAPREPGAASAADPGQHLPDNCIRIYTDGASSGNPGPSGIGVLLLYRDNRKEISEFIGTATNNIAELTAIHRALSTLKRRDLPVRIFTDSSYALGLMTQEWTPRVNKRLVKDIKEMMKEFEDIEVIKVKGHSGIKENEVADFLAVSAIKKEPGP